MNVKYSNGTIFVQFTDGDFLIQDCDIEKAKQVLDLIEQESPKEEIFKLFDSTLEAKLSEARVIAESNERVDSLLEKNKNFIFTDDNKVYYQGIPVSIPKVLVEKMSQTEDEEELEKLINFWCWTSLIRRADSRESFYKYIQANRLPITKEGLVIGFRAAYKKNSTDPVLFDFATTEFNRLKKNKKSTNVLVYLDDFGYNLKGGTQVGILKEIVNNQSDFYLESSSTGRDGKTVKYRIGVESRLPDSEVDWSPDNECSSGLHFSNGRYNINSFGNQRIAVVMNPMDLAAAPYRDNSKARCAALTPLCLINSNEEIENFQITDEIQEIVSQLYQDSLVKLNKFIKEGKFEKDIADHTIFQEVPEVNLTNWFTVLKTQVDPSVVKDRYTKL